MHSVAKCLFNWSSWISARFAREYIIGFGYKSNLPNMAMVFLANVGDHIEGNLFKVITLGIINQHNAHSPWVKIKFLVSRNLKGV